ncbi:MAG: helix-turn-helix domain-containing protein [Desulfobulbus sp.]|nr:helix-turn-helix domain-containing protein [Desulfobulbus sp.]
MIATNGPVVILPREELDALIARAADAAVKRAMAALPKHVGPRPDSVTQADTAKMLGISAPTVRKMIRAGTFTLNKLGKIPMEQVERAMAG